jgi:hypothetical protein
MSAPHIRTPPLDFFKSPVTISAFFFCIGLTPRPPKKPAPIGYGLKNQFLSSIMTKTKEDTFDDNIPLEKQIDLSNTKTYDDIVSEYENSEEENAVISSEELERRTKERMEALGMSDNQAVIQKYEEDQENKAIISYEQLLKNASNISLSYIDETKGKDAPKVSKVEVEQKEVSAPENYLAEEEFLKILKEFRTTL